MNENSMKFMPAPLKKIDVNIILFSDSITPGK
jgi:hypothetical protein